MVIGSIWYWVEDLQKVHCSEIREMPSESGKFDECYDQGSPVDRSDPLSVINANLSGETKQKLSKEGLGEELKDLGCAGRASSRLELIPTGVFIQSIHFIDSNDVAVNGYVWQRYDSDSESECGKLLKRTESVGSSDVPEFGRLIQAAEDYGRGSLDICGVVFPEEIESSNTEEKLVYVKKLENDWVLGWYFDVTVRQGFDYEEYPLDLQKVWLRMWPGDLQNRHQIGLVPDFESYANRTLCPGRTDEGDHDCRGLDQKLVKGPWTLDGTFFDYGVYEYDTSLGLSNNEAQRYFCPELRFNVAARRQFGDAFVINLVPLAIVAVLLWFQVMMVTGKQTRSETLGFNAAGVIGTCAALFFVVVLAHVQLRSEFAGAGVMYMEWFYFIMYGFIFLTTLNAYVFSRGRLKWVNIVFFNDNLIPKISFWPLLLWTMAIVTIAEFWGRLWS